jgi:hypothetical protein
MKDVLMKVKGFFDQRKFLSIYNISDNNLLPYSFLILTQSLIQPLAFTTIIFFFTSFPTIFFKALSAFS